MHAEFCRHLFLREHSGRAKPIISILKAMLLPNMHYDQRRERAARSRA
jgi:hypothetical protein